MKKAFAGLFVVATLLASPGQAMARGVHFGVAARSGFFYPGFAHPGFVDRRFFFRGPAVVFAPYPYSPYPVYPVYPPYAYYVAPP
jgi:hypothetical protein